MKSGQRRWNSHTHVGRGGIVYASVLSAYTRATRCPVLTWYMVPQESNIYVANSNWDYTGVNEGNLRAAT
eukprot:2969203-Rhodomonas_salina.4